MPPRRGWVRGDGTSFALSGLALALFRSTYGLRRGL